MRDYTLKIDDVNSWCSSMVEQLSYKQVGTDIPEAVGLNPTTSTIDRIQNANDIISAWLSSVI